jgi:membrane associated rhomboid family serine protease
MEQVTPQLTAYDLLVFEYGYRPSDPSIVTLFTSMFMHGGFMHLFGNMLFLWIYGDNVEHRLGATGYVVWYLGSGAAATLFHGAFASGSPIPLVGASGAISGILGFYFIWFPHNKVRVLIFLFYFIRVVMLPARWVLGFYIVVSNILPFLVTVGEGSGVAHGAHIGGFLMGVVVALVLNRREMTARHESTARSILRRATGRAPSVRRLPALLRKGSSRKPQSFISLYRRSGRAGCLRQRSRSYWRTGCRRMGMRAGPSPCISAICATIRAGLVSRRRMRALGSFNSMIWASRRRPTNISSMLSTTIRRASSRR